MKRTKFFCSFNERLGAMEGSELERRLGPDMAAEFKNGAYPAKSWRNVPQGFSFTVRDLKRNDIASFKAVKDISP